MGTPAEAVDLTEQSLIREGFRPGQANLLLRVMDQKMQNVLTREYLDTALERHTEQVMEKVRVELTLLKYELHSEFTGEIGKIRLDISERYNRLVLQIAGLLGLSIAIITMLQKIFF